MPVYCYTCTTHGYMELVRGMRDADPDCPYCGARLERRFTPPQTMIRDDDFSNENGGRGRYHPSLADRMYDPKAYIQSRSDCEEKCKARDIAFERV